MVSKIYRGLGFQPLYTKGNDKLGHEVLTWSTLKGNSPIWIPKGRHLNDKEGVYLVGTCGKHCIGCEKTCYVEKSYRHPTVRQGHAKRTIAMRENIDALFTCINYQIEHSQAKMLRINQSGEIETLDEFDKWCQVVANHEDVVAWIYTKNYSVITEQLQGRGIPSNLKVNISIWGTQGIKEYQELKHIPNVKAFVCVTKEYDEAFYESQGLKIDTWCKAYDEKGKLNKNVTCQKCKKCFNNTTKIIGCYEH